MKKILIVEDDQYIRELLTQSLSSEGYDVLQAGSGEEGIESVYLNIPDLIILDLLLPKIDGFEVLRILKDKPGTKHIPVVILSNLGQQEDIERGMELGASEYLVKPQFSLNQINERIKSAFDKAKSNQQNQNK
jgi:DNA-binding response OmpR family regulator